MSNPWPQYNSLETHAPSRTTEPDATYMSYPQATYQYPYVVPHAKPKNPFYMNAYPLYPPYFGGTSPVYYYQDNAFQNSQMYSSNQYEPGPPTLITTSNSSPVSIDHNVDPTLIGSTPFGIHQVYTQPIPHYHTPPYHNIQHTPLQHVDSSLLEKKPKVMSPHPTIQGPISPETTKPDHVPQNTSTNNTTSTSTSITTTTTTSTTTTTTTTVTTLTNNTKLNNENKPVRPLKQPHKRNKGSTEWIVKTNTVSTLTSSPVEIHCPLPIPNENANENPIKVEADIKQHPSIPQDDNKYKSNMHVRKKKSSTSVSSHPHPAKSVYEQRVRIKSNHYQRNQPKSPEVSAKKATLLQSFIRAYYARLHLVELKNQQSLANEL